MNGTCRDCGYCQQMPFANGYLYYCYSAKWYVSEFHTCMWWKPKTVPYNDKCAEQGGI